MLGKAVDEEREEEEKEEEEEEAREEVGAIEELPMSADFELSVEGEAEKEVWEGAASIEVYREGRRLGFDGVFAVGSSS